MLYLNYKLYYKASAQSGTRWHRHTEWRGGLRMLVTGRVRFGGHWCINVSVRGCGGIGVMARGRIGTLMCWCGCGGMRWHIGVGHVCGVGAWGVGAHWHAGACRWQRRSHWARGHWVRARALVRGVCIGWRWHMGIGARRRTGIWCVGVGRMLACWRRRMGVGVRTIGVSGARRASMLAVSRKRMLT